MGAPLAFSRRRPNENSGPRSLRFKGGFVPERRTLASATHGAEAPRRDADGHPPAVGSRLWPAFTYPPNWLFEHLESEIAA
jgi:hypothetical protein